MFRIPRAAGILAAGHLFCLVIAAPVPTNPSRGTNLLVNAGVEGGEYRLHPGHIAILDRASPNIQLFPHARQP